MDILAPSPTSVYRYYDKAGLLLYVGITSRRTRRQAEHNSDKEWWGFVVTQQVEHFDTRAQALAREKSLIRQFRPPFNKQHNPVGRDLREIYLAAASAGPLDYAGTAPQVLTRIKHKLPLSVVSRSDNRVTLAADSDHSPLTRTLHWSHPVPLMASRKLGKLMDHAMMGNALVLTFSIRPDAPDFSEATAQVKAKTKPFKPWIHLLEVAAADAERPGSAA